MTFKNQIELSFSPSGYTNKILEHQGIICKNTFTMQQENEIMLEVDLQSSATKNRDKIVDLQISFTANQNAQPIQYCYPAREFVLSGEDCNYNCAYGYRFPLSFISAFYENMGITIIFDDQKQDSVGVLKEKDKFEFNIQYNNASSQSEPFRILIKFHNNDWHEGFNIYKSWYKNKYKENETIDERLTGCYHIRRYFFHSEFCNKTIYNGEEYSFSDLYHADQTEVGGVDVALLFDYAYTYENNIRCGNAQPFTNHKKIKELNKQLQECQTDNKLATYAYFDPYLIQDGSDFDKHYREQIPVRNQKGEMHHIWSKDQWHPCINTDQWKRESISYLEKVNEKLQVDGFYLDEMGNGEQFICYDKEHNHPVPLDQNKAEYDYVSLIKERFPEKLYMCEFFPTDTNISLFPSVLSDSKTILDICRFAFPYKKIFKIIDCDRPIGNNTWDVNKIFFNGMGLWLDNDLNNLEWYSTHVKALIKKHYKILKKYSDMFESMEIEPLVPTDSDNILANRFTKQNQTVFTFINVTNKDAYCYFKLDQRYVSAYDVYNDTPCKIVMHNGKHSVQIKLDPGSVGCVYVIC